jgi:hypothetical protein
MMVFLRKSTSQSVTENEEAQDTDIVIQGSSVPDKEAPGPQGSRCCDSCNRLNYGAYEPDAVRIRAALIPHYSASRSRPCNWTPGAADRPPLQLPAANSIIGSRA